MTESRERWLLRQIIEALPFSRDWLDPAIEREAKEISGARTPTGGIYRTAGYSVTYQTDGALCTKVCESTGQVRNWAEFNGMAIGDPKQSPAYFAVEHTDGSALILAELTAIVTPEQQAVVDAEVSGAALHQVVIAAAKSKLNRYPYFSGPGETDEDRDRR